MAYKIGTRFKTRNGKVATFVGYWTTGWHPGHYGAAKEDVPYPIVMNVEGEEMLYSNTGTRDREDRDPLDLVSVCGARKKRKGQRGA